MELPLAPAASQPDSGISLLQHTDAVQPQSSLDISAEEQQAQLSGKGMEAWQLTGAPDAQASPAAQSANAAKLSGPFLQAAHQSGAQQSSNILPHLQPMLATDRLPKQSTPACSCVPEPRPAPASPLRLARDPAPVPAPASEPNLSSTPEETPQQAANQVLADEIARLHEAIVQLQQQQLANAKEVSCQLSEQGKAQQQAAQQQASKWQDELMACMRQGFKGLQEQLQIAAAGMQMNASLGCATGQPEISIQPARKRVARQPGALVDTAAGLAQSVLQHTSADKGVQPVQADGLAVQAASAQPGRLRTEVDGQEPPKEVPDIQVGRLAAFTEACMCAPVLHSYSSSARSC